MLKSGIATSLAGLLSLTMIGCQSSSQEMIDLNRVLDLLVEVLDAQSMPASGEVAVAGSAEDLSATATDGESVAGGVVPIDPTKADPAAEKTFLAAFAQKLNSAALITSPIGVKIDDTGAILGFKDPNQNSTMDSGEQKLFSIEIDAEGQRLIASDEQGNRRPHQYRSHGFHGFLLGTMLGRQSNFYSGDRASMKPNFRTQTMSPQNYHSTAMAKSKSSSFGSSSSSTRSKSGSGSFSFGK
ncbi:MAG: hypothetical protein R3C05_07490 [Pirellulaceae bacterium]